MIYPCYTFIQKLSTFSNISFIFSQNGEICFFSNIFKGFHVRRNFFLVIITYFRQIWGNSFSKIFVKFMQIWSILKYINNFNNVFLKKILKFFRKKFYIFRIHFQIRFNASFLSRRASFTIINMVFVPTIIITFVAS